MLPFSYESFLTIFFPRNIYIKKQWNVQVSLSLLTTSFIHESLKQVSKVQSGWWCQINSVYFTIQFDPKASINENATETYTWTLLFQGCKRTFMQQNNQGFQCWHNNLISFQSLFVTVYPRGSPAQQRCTRLHDSNSRPTLSIFCSAVWTPRRTKPGPEFLGDEMQENH